MIHVCFDNDSFCQTKKQKTKNVSEQINNKISLKQHLLMYPPYKLVYFAIPARLISDQNIIV